MRKIEKIISDLAYEHIGELEKSIEKYFGELDDIYFTIEKRYGENYKDIIISEINNAKLKYEIDFSDDKLFRIKINMK